MQHPDQLRADLGDLRESVAQSYATLDRFEAELRAALPGGTLRPVDVQWLADARATVAARLRRLDEIEAVIDVLPTDITDDPPEPGDPIN